MLYEVATKEDALNYRSGPGKHFKKIGEIPSGCCIIGDDIGNGWVRTTLQGATCYLSMKHLKPLDPSTSYALCYTDDEIHEVIQWLEGLL